MAKQNPPCTGDIDSKCPLPEIIATEKAHFGKPAWEFECPNAEELHVTGKGISIKCMELKARCRIDNNKDNFVNASQMSPMRVFLDTTLKYFGGKTKS